MATFTEHIQQAKRNLAFLQHVNHTIPDSIDWQVTVTFYTALHFINAHLSNSGLQYRRHTDVKDALNPYSRLSVSKLPEDEYTAYISLQSLSLRARYLASEKDNNLNATAAFFSRDKHLAKSLRHLETLIVFFADKYGIDLNAIKLKCEDYRGEQARYIMSVKSPGIIRN